MKSKYIILALLLFTVPIIANAQISLRKSDDVNYRFTLEPGKTLNSNIHLINKSGDNISVELYATDGTQTNTGSFTVKSRYAEQKYVGNWLTFETPLVDLAPNETKIIEFSITLPQTVTPGTYGGGISASPARPETASSGMAGAVVASRVVTPLYITIPGEKSTSYEWKEFSHVAEGRHSFIFNIENSGNTIIQAKGSIIISDTIGRETEIPLGIITILQNEKNRAAISWNKKPFAGAFRATANITFYELNPATQEFEIIGEHSKSVSFNVIPWNIIIIGLLLIFALLAIILEKRHLRKKFLARCGKYTVKPGDSLKKIAAASGTTWEKLAEINNINPPYDIEAGGKLLIPPKKDA